MILWEKLYKNDTTHKPQLVLKREVYDFIVKTTKESPYLETGGILIGFDKEPLKVDVNYATLPGPRSYQSSVKFIRDTDYCSKTLNDRFKYFGEDYVGEWHSHVVNLRKMSSGDFMTINSIIQDIDYDFKAFACIVSILQDDEVELIGYMASKIDRYTTNIYNVKIEINENNT